MPNKVFGIGLWRTGTRTLNQCLNKIGLNSIHFGVPHARQIENDFNMGRYNSATLNNYDAITNSCEFFFPQMDAAYPGSKFIMTIRDKESWLVSMQGHFKKMYKRKDEAYMLHQHTAIKAFGVCTFHHERMSYVFDLHQKIVYEYFKNRKSDILVIDVRHEKNISRVCNFLNVGQEFMNSSFEHVQ